MLALMQATFGAAVTSAPGVATGTSAQRAALTGDMFALVGYLMKMSNVGAFDRIAELDLSFTQLKVLCWLQMEGQERSVKALAESMGVSLPAMSRAVDVLFERGFVERDEDPVDRRMKRVRLTRAGHTVPRALNEARLSALQDLIGSLDDEQAAALERALTLIVGDRSEIAAHRPAAKRGRR
jgi:DNA-binding MarR family transcriptional regulator